MACDQQQAGDIKALQKGQQLLDSLRVQACSMLKADDSLYFTGIVKAAMKKKVMMLIISIMQSVLFVQTGVKIAKHINR